VVVFVTVWQAVKAASAITSAVYFIVFIIPLNFRSLPKQPFRYVSARLNSSEDSLLSQRIVFIINTLLKLYIRIFSSRFSRFQNIRRTVNAYSETEILCFFFCCRLIFITTAPAQKTDLTRSDFKQLAARREEIPQMRLPDPAVSA
jgi:hypothetical protein